MSADIHGNGGAGASAGSPRAGGRKRARAEEPRLFGGVELRLPVRLTRAARAAIQVALPASAIRLPALV
jgi:hypothetical protein